MILGETTETIHEEITEIIHNEIEETIRGEIKETVRDVINGTVTEEIEMNHNTLENHLYLPNQKLRRSVHIAEKITQKTTVRKLPIKWSGGRYYKISDDVSTVPKVDIKPLLVKRERVSIAKENTTHQFATRERNLVSLDQLPETPLSTRLYK